MAGDAQIAGRNASILAQTDNQLRREVGAERGLNLLRWIKDRATNRYARQQILLPEKDRARIESMVASVEAGKEIARPSLYWRKLNRMNIEQLHYTGYENFKRTLALNYFTFVNILPWDPQMKAVLRAASMRRMAQIFAQSMAAPSAEFYSSVNWLQTRIYHFLTLAMRERLASLPLDPRLLKLEEPREGGAIEIRYDDGRLISADLCNAMLEYNTAASALSSEPKTIMELGGGYGRTAYVWTAMKSSRYIMVDIAPALFVAERYVSTVAKDRKIFHWRPFTNYAEIAEEFEAADLCFISPDQLELLPDASIDLGLNISSLHEMTIDKIGYFIGQFDRLLQRDGHFYLKAWKRSLLPEDNVVIHRADYPIPGDWSVVVERTPEFQPTFFEAVFKKNASSNK